MPPRPAPRRRSKARVVWVAVAAFAVVIVAAVVVLALKETVFAPKQVPKLKAFLDRAPLPPGRDWSATRRSKATET